MRTLRRPELHAALSPARRSTSDRFGRRAGWTLALLSLAASCLPRLLAQTGTDATIHGAMQDSAGRPVAGAAVSLQSADPSASTRLTRTEADGTFLLPHVAPGEYTLAFQAGSALYQSPQLLTAEAGDAVELTAALPPPGNARALSLRIGQPNAEAPTPPPDEDGDGLTSPQGLSPTQTRAAFDGMEATQALGAVPAGRGSDPAPDPDGDSDSAELTTGPANGLGRGRRSGASYTHSAMREFHVRTDDYSAQSGGVGGASSVSRGGTSSLHGAAFFTLRSQALAARNPLAIATSYADGIVSSVEVKPHDLRENFGVSLGGPVPKVPMLAFFYAFDLQRRGFPAISSPADPNFYSLTATQRALLGTRGLTARQVNAGLNYVSSLTGPTDRRADQTLHFGRLDWRALNRGSKSLTLGAEYNRVRWSSPAGLIDAPTVARGRASIGDASGSLDAALARVTTVVGSHFVNRFRVAWTGDLQFETPQTPLAQEPSIGPGGLAPEVNIGPNGILLGTPASLSRRAYPDERRLQFADTVSLVRGRHLIEFGAEVSLIDERVATLSNSAGTFRYDSGLTKGYAGGLVDFLTDLTFNVNANPNGGCPSINDPTHLFCFRSFSQSFGEDAVAFSTQDWAGFLEDTWRPRHNLTLQAGARYEYTLLPLPAKPNAALDAIFGARGATSVFPEDRNNLGPRASLAYEPFGAGRGLVRLGFGVFFGRVPGATIRAALSDTAQASATTRVRITPSTITACPQVAAQGFGYPCSFTAQPSGTVAATSSAVVFDRRFRLPAIEQGSLTLERGLGRDTTLSATYLMNLDRQLPSSTDLNIAPALSMAKFLLQGGTGAPGVRSGETFSLPLYTVRVTPSFGPVTDVVSNVNATYHGLVLAADWHPVASLRLRGSYTWSKAIDFGQSQSATPRTDGQLDPFTNGYDKGLSALDYPWTVHFTAVWAPRSAHALAGGWELAPIVSARAGRPYSLDLSGGTRLPGGHLSLNGSGGALYLPTVGRNTLRLPATVHVDLRLARTFRAGPRLRLLTSLEAFNLLNHRNVSSVNQRAFLVGTPAFGFTPLVFQDAAAIAAEGLNTQPFGAVTAASTSLARERQLQLNVRLQF